MRSARRGVREAVAVGWVGAALAGLALSCACAGAAQPKIPPDSWQQANASRGRFEKQVSHGRLDYAAIMTEFRAIYHSNPADAHAAASVAQVAELLAEQGRELNDAKSLRDAAGQYEFLAKAYPASSLAAPALASAVQMYGPEGVGDAAEARRVTAELRKRYPRRAAALLAKKAAVPEKAVPGSSVPEKPYRPIAPPQVKKRSEGDPAVVAGRGSVEGRSGGAAGLSTASAKGADSGRDDKVLVGRSGGAAGLSTASAKGADSGRDDKVLVGRSGGAAGLSTASAKGADSGRDDKVSVGRSGGAAGLSTASAKGADSGRDDKVLVGRSGGAAGLSTASAKSADSGRDDKVLVGRSGGDDGGSSLGLGRDERSVAGTVPEVGAARAGTAKVTGIRHWSTPTYTRVAIDLGDEVEYQAARVEHPDRIFFDLHHSRLAQELVGKSFAITDDGFLTKIRAAQYSGDVTRVVLDVHEVTDYSAFLLPNPYRLIIDIHGKAQGSGARVQGSDSGVAELPKASALPKAGVDAVVSSLPPMPVTDGSAGFGLPVRAGVGDVKSAAVAPPRVVIPVKPTVAKPVPNTVASRTGNSGTEVAAVSEQPGKVEATKKPTSAPVAERAQGPGSRVQKASESRAARPVMPAPPTADGETSLLRALGLKIGRIVIDAGHGGHDSGTLGVDGIQEKDVVLDVALRLGKLLHQKMGAEIVYTRADDTFIPLETRTAIANKAQADLFISVHANSSPDASARGVEVYYLNFTSDPEAMRVASRENAVSTKSVHELSDLVKKIALKDKIDESRELAGNVEGSLYKGLEKGNEGLKDRGVKKAPFVVLIGANMPSILAEISFVTNPDDAEQLRMPEYRQRVAESLFNGVARYAAGINGVKTPAVPRRGASSGALKARLTPAE